MTSYFELQKERDGDKIRLDIDISGHEKYRIVPVSLQILVENALKHNAASENSPLILSVYMEGIFVVVANNIQRKNRMNDSYGTGLSNLQERVRLITGAELVVSQENNQFIVKIPLVGI